VEKPFPFNGNIVTKHFLRDHNYLELKAVAHRASPVLRAAAVQDSGIV